MRTFRGIRLVGGLQTRFPFVRHESSRKVPKRLRVFEPCYDNCDPSTTPRTSIHRMPSVFCGQWRFGPVTATFALGPVGRSQQTALLASFLGQQFARWPASVHSRFSNCAAGVDARKTEARCTRSKARVSTDADYVSARTSRKCLSLSWINALRASTNASKFSNRQRSRSVGMR